MSYMHNEMKQKAIKLHFIFKKKSFEVNNVLETVMFEEKNFDSNGANTVSNCAVVLSESLAISEPKVSVSIKKSNSWIFIYQMNLKLFHVNFPLFPHLLGVLFPIYHFESKDLFMKGE